MKKFLTFIFTAIGALFLLNLFLGEFVNPYVLQIVGLTGINIILAVSLNLISGFTGQFSLGHAGFMAIGAYVSAALSVYVGGEAMETPGLGDLLFNLFLLAGGAAAALCGLLIGLPTLRLKGDYLAIVTLGFGEIIRVLLLNMDFIGGARGFSGIPESADFFWIFLWVLLSCAFIWKMVYSMKGRAFMAIREDEIAAQSLGIPPTKIKVTAFVIGAFFAGIGGGLFAHFITYLNPSTFTFLKSVEIVAMVVLGGLGSITGTVLSTIILTSLPEFLRVANDYRMIVYSLLLIIMMILRPRGLMGYKEFRWNRNKPVLAPPKS